MVWIFPGTLAAPSLPNPNLNKSINADSGGPHFWPGHQLEYKFKNDDSKDKLEDIVKAGWKLWTDDGLDKANIDLVETPDGGDNDVLTIDVSSDPKSGDQGGILRWRAYGVRRRRFLRFP